MNRFRFKTMVFGSLGLLLAACSSGEEAREEQPVPVVA